MTHDEIKRFTDDRKTLFVSKSRGAFGCVVQPDATRNKGFYGVIYAKPSKRTAVNLGATREILVLITTFDDQQARTTEMIEHLMQESGGRLESNIAIVLHEDPNGNTKLRNWGRERGIAVLPVMGADLARDHFLLESHLATELFSHDPFDVTGPVSDDTNFFGRRDEALDLARKLNNGGIRSCLGIRKVGKTSLINRVIQNLHTNHDCHTVFVDCSKDSVWSKDAVFLTSWIASSIESAVANNSSYLALNTQIPPSQASDINASTTQLQKAVEMSMKPVVLILDEIDYVTPGSPTAADKWKLDFNRLWRNFRSVYQEATRSSKKLSVLVAGVSSKWFFVGKIGDIENAALALIPEEYLSPLPRGATEAMIKNIAKRAGLQFEQGALSELAATAGDIPYWCRKLCSYIHRNTAIEGRPIRMDTPEAKELISRFVDSEGGAISRVALAHLFSVYPELTKPAALCSDGKGKECSAHHANVLERYGVIRPDRTIAGRMMDIGVRLALSADDAPNEVLSIKASQQPVSIFGEWAEELSAVGRRRNVLEKKLRSIVVNLIRFDSLSSKEKPPAKERVLKALADKRKKELEFLALDDLLEKLFWPELIALAGREWTIFERIFGAKDKFTQAAEIINDRPDAHAKGYDAADFALYRRSLKYLEDALRAID